MVDCSRCFHKACCVIFSVNLKRHELDKFDVEQDLAANEWYLRRTGVGQCVYLSQEGTCQIHHNQPKVCKTWDCTDDPRWPILLEHYLSGTDKQTR